MGLSFALILWYSRLAALLPGAMMRYPPRSTNTFSLVSSRKLPWRLSSSGPWQAKQASERIGRTSRSKSTGFSVGLGGACHAPSGRRHNAIAAAVSHRQMIGRIKEPPRPIELPAIPYYVNAPLGSIFLGSTLAICSLLRKKTRRARKLVGERTKRCDLLKTTFLHPAMLLSKPGSRFVLHIGLARANTLRRRQYHAPDLQCFAGRLKCRGGSCFASGVSKSSRLISVSS